MAKLKRLFRITKTSDEDYEVVDMEESKEETIDIEEEEKTDDEETMDMQGMEDMCKDMGYESIKDALEDLKKSKEETSDAEEEETDDEKSDEETEDAEKEETEDADEEEEESSTGDAAPNLSNIEEALATIPKGKVRDAAIKALGTVKDSIKGYVKVKDQISAGLLKAKDEDADEEEELESITYAEFVKDSVNH